MGADFVFNWIAIKKGDEKAIKKKLYKAIDNFNIPELSENTKQQIITSLEKENSKNFRYFKEFWEEGIYGEFEEDYPINDEGNIITIEEAGNKMKEIVDDLLDNLDNREMGVIEFEGFNLYLSGGMSWGDNPTDTYNNLTNFNMLPSSILEEAGVK